MSDFRYSFLLSWLWELLNIQILRISKAQQECHSKQYWDISIIDMSISFDICHHSQYLTLFTIYLYIQFHILQGFLAVGCSPPCMNLVLGIKVSQTNFHLVSNTHHQHSLQHLPIILHFPYSSCIVLSSTQTNKILESIRHSSGHQLQSHLVDNI